MRERLMRFMAGRYGPDQLSKFLNVLVMVLLIVSMFTRLGILYWFALALLIYCYFRIFSRNHQRRYAENARYLKMTAKFRNSFQAWQRDAKTRKTHHIYRCPSCRQKIRVPKGKGKIAIRCPKCSIEFIKKS